MHILILQHEDSTPPGSVLEWIHIHHFSYTIHFFSNGSLDPEFMYDALFICGGSPNVDQELDYPWLIEEKKFIRSALSRKCKIIGLCLGSQLLAEALGGSVFKAAEWEVGWQNIKLLGSGETLCVFQWHGYQFISPPRSIRIAENECCAHQGFYYSDHVIAYQFHPESTKKWVIECANDPELPAPGRYVQTKEEMIKGNRNQDQLQAWFFKELNQFFSLNL